MGAEYITERKAQHRRVDGADGVARIIRDSGMIRDDSSPQTRNYRRFLNKDFKQCGGQARWLCMTIMTYHR